MGLQTVSYPRKKSPKFFGIEAIRQSLFASISDLEGNLRQGPAICEVQVPPPDSTECEEAFAAAKKIAAREGILGWYFFRGCFAPPGSGDVGGSTVSTERQDGLRKPDGFDSGWTERVVGSFADAGVHGNPPTDRPAIMRAVSTTSSPMHCGEWLEIRVTDDRGMTCRLELDRDWYVITKEARFYLRKKDIYQIHI
jgi:hypothetical protein